jgi:hypothetical protein
LPSPTLWRTFSGFRVCVWVIAIPVAYFLGWIYSVAFVAVCSLYANAASDLAAWRSDVDPNTDRLERIERRLSRIERNLDRLLEG